MSLIQVPRVRAPHKVRLVRDGSLVFLYEAPATLLSYLEPALTYAATKFLRGREQREALDQGRPPFLRWPVRCYEYANGAFLFRRGFLPRVQRILKEHGYRASISWEKANPCYQAPPDWDHLFDWIPPESLRYKQDEVLLAICSNECGIINFPTAAGKSFLLRCLVLLYPRATFDIAATSQTVIRQIHNDLSHSCGDVGLIGAGKFHRGPRINCYCARSLHHSPMDADFFIADEVHRFGAPSYVEATSGYVRARCYGLTATHGMRGDTCDMELEGTFGPVIANLSDREAGQQGLNVPREVHWYSFHSSIILPEKDPTPERFGIWRNAGRNQAIALLAREYEKAGDPILVYCTTVEHILELRRYLEDYTAIYGQVEASREAQFRRHGLIDAGERLLRNRERVLLEQQIRAGQIQKVLATSVCMEGFDWPELAIVIRADAGAGKTDSIQLGGRPARIHPSKTKAIIVDLFDSFRPFHRRAGERRRIYTGMKWQQLTKHLEGAHGNAPNRQPGRRA